MTWKLGPPRQRGPRNTSSNATKRADRERAQAEGFALNAQETNLRCEKTEKLRKLREQRDAEETKAEE